MTQASVGFHCPECARKGAQRVVRPRDLTSTRPVVAVALVIVNVAVFVWDAGDTTRLLTREGGVFGPAVAAGEWWRIVTSGFLHFNLIHLGFNCFLIYQLGMLLEPVLGRVRFGLVYACAILGGSLGALLVTPDVMTAGASGGVFGLMGAAVVVLRARGIDIFQTGIGGLLVLNLIFTFVFPGISIGGHLGGLFAGTVAGWLVHDAAARVGNDLVPLAATVALGAGLAVAALQVV
jgi:membrane associated rhomboid family serine protease